MEKIRKTLMVELALCLSKRDVARVFDAAETEFRARAIPPTDRQQLLKEIEKNLPTLIKKDDRVLIEEARTRIQLLLDRKN
jgi:hypothetical protein